ncbi:catechol O-methyltransferase B [Antennarius striatus]|uniref:catechol O-methyltransferase B n=1 Tax=Antennarius striatus TaxID=241820 RepID=UPI0035AED504
MHRMGDGRESNQQSVSSKTQHMFGVDHQRRQKAPLDARDHDSGWSEFCLRVMSLTLVYSTGAAALLYALFRWVMPAVVQYHGGLAVFWHEAIMGRVLDTLTQSTQPQRLLGAVQKNSTRGNPRSVVQSIDDYCRHQEWAMNVGDEKGCILDSTVSEVNPTYVLELGTYCGYSAVRIASLLGPHAKLYTLEFNKDHAAVARQVIAWAGLEDRVQLVEGSSSEWIPKIKEEFGVKTFDLVFLDHWKEAYLPDTKLMEESGLLRKGTVLLADNVIYPGAPQYLEYIRSSPRYKSQFYQSHLEYTKAADGMEKSVFLG